MKPAEKSKQMEEVLEKVSQDQWGRSRLDSINNDTCVSCGGPAKDFRDELSTKEFTISGFCQVCQDKTFGKEDPPKGNGKETTKKGLPLGMKVLQEMIEEDGKENKSPPGPEVLPNCLMGLPGYYDHKSPCGYCDREPTDDCYYEIGCNAHAIDPLVHKIMWIYRLHRQVFSSGINEYGTLDEDQVELWKSKGYEIVDKGYVSIMLQKEGKYQGEVRFPLHIRPIEGVGEDV